MKIAYFITKAEWGGAQAHLFELIDNESLKGNEIVLMIGDTGRLVEKAEKLPNVKVIILKHLKANLTLLKDSKAVREVRNILKQENPDIFHLHSSKAGAIGRLAAVNQPCKVIFTAHGWAFTENVDKRKRFIYKNIESILAKVTDKIICVSAYDYQLGLKMNVIDSKNSVVVYNGCSIPNEEMTKPRKNDDSLVNITMVARFSSPKEQLQLIKAISIMKNKKRVKLNLVGEGNLLEDCKVMTETLGLEKQVVFSGFQSNVDSFLKDAHIFCLVSNYEGLPISIIEAMRMSLPIIASNVGGIPELVVDGTNGYLIERSNIDQLAEKLDYIIDNNLFEEMGNASYLLAKEKFSINQMFENTNKVYQSVI